MRSRCRCSMCPAIHINSRSWLRSSSTHEPSDPPLRVVILFHRSAHRGNSEHASTVGVRSVSAASFQSWISSLVTSEFEKSCASWGGRETDSLNRRKAETEAPAFALVSGKRRTAPRPRYPNDADETCKSLGFGTRPRGDHRRRRRPIFP